MTAVALQDHLVKSLGLNDVIGPRQIGLGPAARAKQRKPVRSSITIGRFGRSKFKFILTIEQKKLQNFSLKQKSANL